MALAHLNQQTDGDRREHTLLRPQEGKSDEKITTRVISSSTEIKPLSRTDCQSVASPVIRICMVLVALLIVRAQK